MLGDLLALRREYLDWRRDQRAGPEERIRRRQRIKDEIAQNLPASRTDYAPEVIVRDLARVDEYPDVDDRPWGISSWFKVEAKGLYHRGLEVFVAVEELVVDGTSARRRAHPEETPGETMYVTGRMPFDAIVHIDWDGDEYYPMPHVYCWFDQVDGPYEEIVLYEPGYQDHLLMRDDLRYVPLRPTRSRQWRDQRSLKKAQREFERQAGQLQL